MQYEKEINKFQGQYRWLSNFWPCLIHYNGLEFRSVENAYQASKCKYPENMKRFVDVSAAESKRLSKNPQIIKREDWDQFKVSMMFYCLHEKFCNNKELNELLINTEGYYLEEGNTWGDTFWGVCNNVGANILGQLLMSIRNVLSYNYNSASLISYSINKIIIYEFPYTYYINNYALQIYHDNAAQLQYMEIEFRHKNILNFIQEI